MPSESGSPSTLYDLKMRTEKKHGVSHGGGNHLPGSVVVDL